MSEAFDQGLVPLALRVVRGFSTCEGEGVVVAVRDPSTRSPGQFRVPTRPAGAFAPGSAERALAALLREREAQGHRDGTVLFELHGPGDLHWVAEAISWLRRYGRQVVLRTHRVLPRPVVEAAREAGARVLLRIASFDPVIGEALLGPTADPAARLLLGAQHLRARDIAVGVLVAPLMPVVHRDDELEGLCRHIAAADLRHVSFAIGGWSPARHRALTAVLPFGAATGLARAFEIFDVDTAEPSRQVRLGLRAASLLQQQARRIAEDAGLTVQGCGCEAQCHLSARGGVDAEDGAGEARLPAFRSLIAPGLFELVG